MMESGTKLLIKMPSKTSNPALPLSWQPLVETPNFWDKCAYGGTLYTGVGSSLTMEACRWAEPEKVGAALTQTCPFFQIKS